MLAQVPDTRPRISLERTRPGLAAGIFPHSPGPLGKSVASSDESVRQTTKATTNRLATAWSHFIDLGQESLLNFSAGDVELTMVNILIYDWQEAATKTTAKTAALDNRSMGSSSRPWRTAIRAQEHGSKSRHNDLGAVCRSIRGLPNVSIQK